MLFPSWKTSRHRRSRKQVSSRPQRNSDRTLHLEALEQRTLLSTFATSASQLNLVLGPSANDNVSIVTNGPNYSFTLNNGDTWGGNNDANVTGAGSNVLTVTSAGENFFTAAISIKDSGAFDSVTFGNGDSYFNSFNVQLAQSGNVTFNGSSSFNSGTSLTAITNGGIVVSSGASLETQSGAISLEAIGSNSSLNAQGSFIAGGTGGANILLQSTGNLSVGTVNGSGSLTLTSSAGAITQSGPIDVPTLSASASTGIALGASNAVSNVSATNSTSGNISLVDTQALTVGSIVESGGGSVSVSSTGTNTALTVNHGVTDSGGSVALSATGNLLVAGSATVLGSNITLQGADESIAGSVGLPGNAPATVTIESSVESRPMLIGGTNAIPVGGINLTTTELSHIVTSAGGTITIGDANQIGIITLDTATPATMVGAATHIVQSATGAGQVILDNHTGGIATALSGTNGPITITAGTGGIVEASSNLTGVVDLGGASSVTLTTAGPIGTASNPVQFSFTSLTTNTSATNSSEFLSALNTNTVTASSLSAGSGTINLQAGRFQLGAANAISSTTALSLANVAGACSGCHGGRYPDDLRNRDQSDRKHRLARRHAGRGRRNIHDLDHRCPGELRGSSGLDVDCVGRCLRPNR